jgi:eukaryotic-like serine/threonine-protein kinase
MNDDRQPDGAPLEDAAHAPPSLLELGGKFEVLEPIGRGGMGAVYRVRHRKLDHVRAVKVLPAGATPEAVERLRREAAIATGLAHPSIVTIYDLEELPDGGLAIVMENLEGADLGRHLRNSGPLAAAEVVRIFAGAVDALDRMHAAGVIHRDLKPGNLFVCRDGALKILDFGISRVLDDDSALTRTGQSLGTPAFMAPEQLEGSTLSPQADVYALGAVLYLCLCGQRPHAGATQAELIANVLLHEPPRADAVRPSLPAGIGDVLQRALAKDPGQRFATAGELLDALRPAAALDTGGGTLTMDPVDRPAPAGSAAATSATTAATPLTTLAPGTVVDRYEVESVLGRGGMAVVYRVRHRHLDSRHALKVLQLPARAIEARLLQEGRVQSALKHPNVVAVTDLIDVAGSPGLIMEYVDGPALSALLDAGPLTLAVARQLSRPVLQGIAAAHRHGLIHRDLKPANVLLDTATGEVVPKITDFGLAKLLDLDGGRSPLETRSGAPMGTPAFMAPEQIRDASTVDERADVFAAGAMLYELLGSQRAFQGRDTMEVFTAVTLGRVTPLRELRPTIPAPLVAVVHRALATDPEQRYPDGDALMQAWDAAVAEAGPGAWTVDAEEPDLLDRVRRIGRGPAPSPLSPASAPRTSARSTRSMPAAGRPSADHPLPPASAAPTEVASTPLPTLAPDSRTRWTRVAIVATVIAGALAVAWFAFDRLANDGTPANGRPTFPLTGDPVLTQLTFEPGHQYHPALSPDGRQLLYSDGTDLYLRRVDGDRALNLTEDFEPPARTPAWSPDGERIAFVGGTAEGLAIHVMGALGEGKRQVADAGDWPTWSPDGERLAYTTTPFSPPMVITSFQSELWIVELASGERRLVDGESNARMPDWSPTGDRIAYLGTVDSWYRIFTIRPDGTGRVALGEWEAWCPRWLSDGRHVCAISDRGDTSSVQCTALDPESGQPDGEPRTLFTAPGDRAWHLAVSGDDTRWALTAVDDASHIHAAELDPATGIALGPPRAITTGAQRFGGPDASPDGQWLAFTSRGPHENLYVARTDGSELRALSSGEVYTRGPQWSPDGEQIAFFGTRDGVDALWSVRPDGGGLRRLSGASVPDPIIPLWSPDGTHLAFNDGTPQPYCIDLDGDFDAQVAAQRDPAKTGWWATDWSPDGRWLTATRALDLQLARIDTTTCTVERVFDRGYYAVWAPDSRHLYVADDGKVVLLDTETGEEAEAVSIAPGTLPGTPMLSVSPDGRTLYIAVDHSDADLWIAQFPTPD